MNSSQMRSMIEQSVHSIQVKVEIRAYEPTIFSQIRQLDGIIEEELINSLMPRNNRDQIFNTSQNAASSLGNDGGNSGSFFFFTQDKKFLVKTMTVEERDLFIKMLPDFLKHCQSMSEKKQGSIIAKIIGVYRVKL